jgi:hypothetical protein
MPVRVQVPSSVQAKTETKVSVFLFSVISKACRSYLGFFENITSMWRFFLLNL